MTIPAIITVAITGAIPTKKMSQAVPVTPDEQIESVHEAFEAGATIAHIHVRNSDQSHSSNPERFAQVQEGIKKHCPGMIVQFSTGGRGLKQEERGAALYLRPDMASLATGSVNFKTVIYENHPELVEGLAARMRDLGIKPEIEIFDLAMLYAAQSLVKEGMLDEAAHVQFVLGIPNALPARRKVLGFLVSELNEVLPKATWTAAGIGRHQIEVVHMALELGGHVRTGLEDNLKIDNERLAKSNAELVQQAASLCARYDRHVASADEARKILGLSPGNQGQALSQVGVS